MGVDESTAKPRDATSALAALLELPNQTFSTKMATPIQGDYVLGTTDVEIARLGLQHQVWRPSMLEGWTRAGLAKGMRAVDVGAGPGYATLDLAEAVGPSGYVLALERSPRFTSVLREECRRRGLEHVEILEADVLDQGLLDHPRLSDFDLAWCRWLACFLPEVDGLARLLAGILRPGGRVLFHEYLKYETWQSVPPLPHHGQFIAEVMDNWRSGGGEPDVAARLATALREAGLTIEAMRPLVFVAAPGEPMWQWPATFIRSHSERLLELGRVSPEWCEAVRNELARAEADPQSRMVTPLVLEVVARGGG